VAQLQIIENPERQQWALLLARPVADSGSLDATVRAILGDVKKNGNKAIDAFSLQFEKVSINNRVVDEREFDEAENKLSNELQLSICHAKKNIETFHKGQFVTEPRVQIQAGIECWRKSVAIEKVGLYIPGGTAPLFSTLLMLGVPAILAGCEEIIVCTPPQSDGSVHPAILYTAKILGIRKIFKVGGAQAIAALAYGTSTIPAVDKIFGPGNPWVTHAKKVVQQEGVSIDMPAGPSELAVYADETANPSFVAADLLSQCEHGTDSQVVLVTESHDFAERVNQSIRKQIEKLPRRAVAEKALENSRIFIIPDRAVALSFLNMYAPEHLILACRQAAQLAEKVRNAGSVFIGNFAPESAGDYATGTNHTLPTHGFARTYSGVSVDSFMKKISFQQLSFEGLQSIGNTVMEMARAEGLEGHAVAVEIRLSGEK
jgi:histidinol dehydrogenase